MNVLKRIWIPLVILVVVGVATFTVMRVRTFFGTGPGYVSTENSASDESEPFDPKVVKYEIWGEPGATANINYMDLDAKPQRADNAPLPWTLTLSTTAPSVFPTISAQGDGDSLSCRITVDDEVKDERTVNGVGAHTYCLVKSA
ncbi:MmpS family transport accessory protein [Mycolicibacterium sp. 120266]|uniref:MmpS family transport accessory protein n=1 Tax=Mycolicibacterium sp. 120266 TaxID=3090601 RepID=UPI00299E5D86|nr:MmpS family transport accessory protein [Mycolicibacterium sp. 120266]MDX1872315.1 MmpS family transport accessory protein [Mycolicibacterium sp. 120266]